MKVIKLNRQLFNQVLRSLGRGDPETMSVKVDAGDIKVLRLCAESSDVHDMSRRLRPGDVIRLKTRFEGIQMEPWVQPTGAPFISRLDGDKPVRIATVETEGIRTEEVFYNLRLIKSIPDVLQAAMDFIAHIDSLPDDTEKCRILKMALNNEPGERLVKHVTYAVTGIK